MGEGHCWQWDQEGNGRRPAWCVPRRKGEVVRDEVAGVGSNRLASASMRILGFHPRTIGSLRAVGTMGHELD